MSFITVCIWFVCMNTNHSGMMGTLEINVKNMLEGRGEILFLLKYVVETLSALKRHSVAFDISS